MILHDYMRLKDVGEDHMSLSQMSTISINYTKYKIFEILMLKFNVKILITIYMIIYKAYQV